MLLPTPVVNDMGEGKTVERWDEWTAEMQAKHGNGNGHGRSLAIEAMRLLPTPTAIQGRNRTSGRSNPDSQHHDGVTLNDWVRLLPTPAAWDGDRGPDYARMNRQGSGGDDLVTTLARLNGDRMRPPSAAGSSSSDAPPPPPPTTEGDSPPPSSSG